jgi:hypothetical protein
MIAPSEIVSEEELVEQAVLNSGKVIFYPLAKVVAKDEHSAQV